VLYSLLLVFDSIFKTLILPGMATYSPVFAQITRHLDPTQFARCAELYPPARPPRGLSAYDHFLALCFAQLTHRESLRDLAACLQTHRAYHAGFRTHLSRSNLAYANRHRDWRVLAAVAQVLMRRVRRAFELTPADPLLPEVAYALDASIIDLSLTLFPWAHWESQAAAVKLHTLLALRSQAPAWITVTEAGFPEQKSLAQLPLEPGAFYVMDRGYLDFPRLARFDSVQAWFVVRSKCHVRFRVLESRPVDKSTGLRCDQIILLTTRWSRRAYPQKLRRVRVRDEERGISLVLLTNHLDLPAATIALLYRKRWQVELFFKWIKQHLRLRAFLGRSPNAVRCQIWAAVCAYLLVVLAKKELGLEQSLHQILQIVSVSAFEQTPLAELLAKSPSQETETSNSNQLLLNII
jgi:hypothetical protein